MQDQMFILLCAITHVIHSNLVTCLSLFI